MRVTLEFLIAVISFGLVLLALAWWALSDEPVITTSPPTWKGASVVTISATAPVIGKFDYEYYKNESDPFVPDVQREDQIQTMKIKTNPHPPRRTPAQRPVVNIVEPPVLVFPPPAAHADGPKCIGLISSSQGTTVLVLMPGAVEPVSMGAGDSIPKDAGAARQWTLIGVESDQMVRFREPSGTEIDLPIASPPSDPPPDSDSSTTAPAPAVKSPPPSVPPSAPGTSPPRPIMRPPGSRTPGMGVRTQPPGWRALPGQQPTAPIWKPAPTQSNPPPPAPGQ